MKHAASTLVIAMAVFLIGCQDNSIVNPLDAAYNAPFLKAAESEEVIIIKTDVSDGSTMFEVSGQVKYKLTRSPILREESFDLNLTPDVIISSGRESWSVNISSLDKVNLTRRESAAVEKYYVLRGGPASITFSLRLEVTSTRVSLAGVSIQ